jgi:hypothetical protein
LGDNQVFGGLQKRTRRPSGLSSLNLPVKGTDEASAWLEDGRMELIRNGWPGISEFIDQTCQPLRSKTKLESLDSLKTYLTSHVDHLNYAQRLAEGRSIGSGQVEGACKT